MEPGEVASRLGASVAAVRPFPELWAFRCLLRRPAERDRRAGLGDGGVADYLAHDRGAADAELLRDGSEGGFGVLGYLELDEHPVVVFQVFHMLSLPFCSPPGGTIKG